MIAFAFSHWGLLLEPDEIGVMENVLFNSDGSVQALEEGLPMVFEIKDGDPTEQARRP